MLLDTQQVIHRLLRHRHGMQEHWVLAPKCSFIRITHENTQVLPQTNRIGTLGAGRWLEFYKAVGSHTSHGQIYLDGLQRH